MYSLDMSETYHVYILHCRDGSYYVGITNNLERRLTEHQEGMDPDSYTHDKRPVKLVYSVTFTDIRDAIRWEKEVKGWRREKKEALIQKQWESLPSLSRRQHLQRDPSRLADAHAPSRTSG